MVLGQLYKFAQTLHSKNHSWHDTSRDGDDITVTNLFLYLTIRRYALIGNAHEQTSDVPDRGQGQALLRKAHLLPIAGPQI